MVNGLLVLWFFDWFVFLVDLGSRGWFSSVVLSVIYDSLIFIIFLDCIKICMNDSYK